MRELGRVVSGHPYALPEGWSRVPDEVLDVAMGRAREALAVEVGGVAQEPSGRVERYFDPGGGFAGATFNSMDRAAAAWNIVSAADLLAVTLLSMEVTVEQVRHLLEDGPKRAAVNAALAAVPRDVALAECGTGTRDFAVVFDRLYTLYNELRTTPDDDANRWVFASKLCARKLPHLMPVRDNVVCEYLAGKPLSSRGGLSHFTVDMQVFAFLMSDPDLRAQLKELHARLRNRHGSALDAVPLLRILDVTLWMAGRDAGLGRRS